MCYKFSRLKMMLDLMRLDMEHPHNAIKRLAKGYDYIYEEWEEDWQEMCKLKKERKDGEEK